MKNEVLVPIEWAYHNPNRIDSSVRVFKRLYVHQGVCLLVSVYETAFSLTSIK